MAKFAILDGRDRVQVVETRAGSPGGERATFLVRDIEHDAVWVHAHRVADLCTIEGWITGCKDGTLAEVLVRTDREDHPMCRSCAAQTVASMIEHQKDDPLTVTVTPIEIPQAGGA